MPHAGPVTVATSTLDTLCQCVVLQLIPPDWPPLTQSCCHDEDTHWQLALLKAVCRRPGTGIILINSLKISVVLRIKWH